ncbi:MAG: NUDIX domain-containing protein [Verrucomicrobiota bacterium]
MPAPKDAPYCYKYPHPAVTVDIIVFAIHEDDLKVLLIQRKGEPYRNFWALPGGFVEINESVDTAALRELHEETGVEDVFLEQLYTFGEPKRDPRERVISVAYYSLVFLKEHTIRAASDALNACWFPIHDLPALAFDHPKIMSMAIKRLQGKVVYAPVIFSLLPPKFRLNQLRRVYEIILEHPIDAKAFRKHILSMGILTQLDEVDKTEPGPPAPLYRFDRKKYERMEEKGFEFEVKPVKRKKSLNG